MENKFNKRAVVFNKDNGMAFEVYKMSHANGIKHFNLLCTKTGSIVQLSKFALEKDYNLNGGTSEKVGLRIVRRLSEMFNK